MTDQEINLAIERITGQRRDYCNDLNAAHQAWSTLSPVQKRSYTSILWNIVKRENPISKRNEWVGTDELAINATARQRAEAYVRTVGKWKE